MRKIFWIIIFITGISLIQGTYAKEHTDDTIRYCPVSKEKIEGEPEYTYEYMGKTYYFCCPECIEEFKKNPEKYINNHDDTQHKHHHHSH